MAPAKPPEIDTSLSAWIANIQYMLYFPATILTVIGLIVAGTFAEITPRESLKFLDNYLGMGVLFMIPFIVSRFLDWPTGLLAAVVTLIIFARLNVHEPTEGFRNAIRESDDDIQTTTIVGNSHRWFVEKILGETPVAISSDRIITTAVQDQNTRSSSTSATSATTSGVSSSSSSSSGSHAGLSDIFSSFQK